MPSTSSAIVASSQIPAIPPPPGVTPNFDSHVSQAPTVLTANWLITSITLLFVLARLFAKVKYARKQFGLEDIFCVIGTFLTLIFMGIITWLLTGTGIGHHSWDIPLSILRARLPIMAAGIAAASVITALTLIFVKLSILCLFFRLFSVSRRARIWIYLGAIGTIVTLGTGSAVIVPVVSPEHQRPGIDYPTRLNKIVICIGAVNLFGDIYILILPMLEVSRLHMYKGRKLRVMAVFSTGALACIAGLMGLLLRLTNWPHPDITWKVGPLMVAPIYEINIGLIVGCMPILPLFLKHSQNLKRLLSYIHPSGTRDQTSGQSNDPKVRNGSDSSDDRGNNGLKIVASHALLRQYHQLDDNENKANFNV